MRHDTAIVQISALAMLDVGKQVAFRHPVTSQFVGHDHSRHILQTFQQAPEESLRGRRIAAFLNEDVEHNAILIHGARQTALHAGAGG